VPSVRRICCMSTKFGVDSSRRFFRARTHRHTDASDHLTDASWVTRVPRLSRDVVCVIPCLAVSTEHRLVTDGQRDKEQQHIPR